MRVSELMLRLGTALRLEKQIPGTGMKDRKAKIRTGLAFAVFHPCRNGGAKDGATGDPACGVNGTLEEDTSFRAIHLAASRGTTES